jgi:glycerol-3-phosphate dehydrogenase
VTGSPPPAFQIDSRPQNLRRLQEAPVDVLILGGGINGAGIARDLALRAQTAARPLRIGLVEKRHFGSGTSGRNSQLIHGGLRYLKYFEFRLVKEALQERATLLEIAPHLVEPLPMLIPFYSWWSRQFYGTGLWLYDLLAGAHNIGRRKYLSRDDVRRIEPQFNVEGLHSAAIYFDCRVHSARGVLENIFDAARAGAIAANYTEAGMPERRGDGFVLECADALSGDRFAVKARRLVDARGPWEESRQIRLVRGSHIIVPRLNTSDNAIAYFGPDGRIVFVIPWGEARDLSLVGTTDVDHRGSPDDVRISAAEVEYLVAVVRRLFPQARNSTPVAAYSSLRPLAASGSGSATAASRDHRISMEDGVVKIAGGKYTTYRSMSAEAVDLLAKDLAPELVGLPTTAAQPLGGNSPAAYRELLARAPELARQYSAGVHEVARVIHSHGLQALHVLNLSALSCSPELGITSYAVRHEMAHRLADVVFVSTYWGHERTPEQGWLRPLAEQMAGDLGWAETRIEEEIDLVLRIAAFPSP